MLEKFPRSGTRNRKFCRTSKGGCINKEFFSALCLSAKIAFCFNIHEKATLPAHPPFFTSDATTQSSGCSLICDKRERFTHNAPPSTSIFHFDVTLHVCLNEAIIRGIAAKNYCGPFQG